jgi:hypothetical protein
MSDQIGNLIVESGIRISKFSTEGNEGVKSDIRYQNIPKH